jgi:predicted nucleotidyltransferase
MIKRIFHLVESTLRRHDLSLDRLMSLADEVIVFGSYASGVARADSDVDILCIGDVGAVHTAYLDLTRVSREFVQRPEWNQSELANHVAAYGVWLNGEGLWKREVFIAEQTLARKQRAVANHIDALEKRWSSLAEQFQRSHLQAIQRNLQRLQLMRAGKPVCPTALLGKDVPFDTSLGRSALNVARERLAAG